MTKEAWPNPANRTAVHIAVSALVTAPMLDIFLFGILVAQVASYLRTSLLRLSSARPPSSTSGQDAPTPISLRPQEPRAQISKRFLIPSKILTTHSNYLVLFLLLFSAIKTTGSVAMVFLVAFHEGDYWLSLGTAWPFYSGPLLTAIIGLTVQIFYIHRLYLLLHVQTGTLLGKRWVQILISLTIVLLVLISFVSIVISTHLIRTLQWNLYVYYSMAHLISASVSDLLITTLTILCILLANRRNMHPRKRSLLQRVARITALSAVLPTILAIINLVIIAQPNKDITRWHIVPNFALSKFYVFSLIWTLRYRNRIIASDQLKGDVPRLKHPGVPKGDKVAITCEGDAKVKGTNRKPSGKVAHIHMDVITDEGNERRTSIEILNRTSMFARTVMTTQVEIRDLEAQAEAHSWDVESIVAREKEGVRDL